jgi:hypothetical protein
MSLIGIIFYAWLLFFSGWAIFALQITNFLAMSVILGILSWIGYTAAKRTSIVITSSEHIEEASDNEPA